METFPGMHPDPISLRLPAKKNKDNAQLGGRYYLPYEIDPGAGNCLITCGGSAVCLGGVSALHLPKPLTPVEAFASG